MNTKFIYSFMKSKQAMTLPDWTKIRPFKNETFEGKDVHVIALSDLEVKPSLFQFRETGEGTHSSDFYRSKTHIKNLSRPLSNPEIELDPITIAWISLSWIDGMWTVIEGHHRVEAYKSNNRCHIPCVIFEGDRVETVLQALSSNLKDKLPMTQSEKLDAQWTIFVGMEGMKYQSKTLLEIGTVSSTLQKFRVHKRGIQQHGKKPQNFTWREAKRFIKGINNMKEVQFDENELAKRWAYDIYNKFGNTARNSPSVFGDAIKMYMGEYQFQNMVEYHTAIDADGEF